MEIDSSPLQVNLNEVDSNGKKLNRNNKCGVRVIGNRIYDSENGKSCHQCRQKTRDFSAACKNPRTGKPCQIRFCHKCLLNRYGEKAEEVDLLNDWMCPKCRGICNCSFCMKKRGEQPTGILVHSAKASGFNSVSAMLRKKASEGLESNNAVVLPIKEATLEKELVLDLSKEPGKQNSLGGNKGLKVENEKNKKMKQKKLKEATMEMELVLDLSEDPGKQSSLGGNKGLKVENEKNKKMKQKKLKEATMEKELVVDLSGEPVKQNSVGGNIGLKVENGKTKTTKQKKLKEATMEKELVVDLSGEPEKQNSVGGNKGLKVGNEKTKTMKRKKLKEATLGKELVVDLSGEPGKQNSVGGNIGLKVENEKTTLKRRKLNEATLRKELVLGLSCEPGKENSLGGVSAVKVGREKTKKVKRENLKEISNGNSADDACQNKKLKKPKLCNRVSEGEVKPKANAEMGTKVGENHGTVVIGDGDNDGAKYQTNAKVLHAEKIKEEIPFPVGTEMTKILDIEFAPEDVGNALQFLEFCRVFGKALDVKKGEAGAILRALIRKQNLRRGQNTVVVEFQIKLLTLIVSDSDSDSETESSSLTASNGKNSWLKVLEDLITESDLVLKEFPSDWLNKGISGYYDLDLSKKLILLNFICDEALDTVKLRSYIDDQNASFVEEKKAAKSKVVEAKEKERSLKQKLQDEIAKAVVSNGANLSISEHDALIAKIKSEAAKAHTELIEVKGSIPKRNQHSDTVRIEPEYLDNNGKAFWKLRSCNEEYAFLLQDVKIHDEDAVKVDEKWFVYGVEQKDEVDKYISSRRDWLPKLTSV